MSTPRPPARTGHTEKCEVARSRHENHQAGGSDMGTTIQVQAHQINEDAARADVSSAAATDQDIAESTAVTIAAWWQSPGSVGHVLAAFASGAQVSAQELLDDIDATRRHEGYHTGAMAPPDRQALDCLESFVQHR